MKMYKYLIFYVSTVCSIGQYSWHSDDSSFGEAIAKCKNEGQVLASASNKHDYIELKSFYGGRSSSAYIGLQYNYTESSYQWLDGTFIDVVDWDSGEPVSNNGNRRCAYIRDGRWQTDDCLQLKYYVCVDFSVVPVYKISSVKVSHGDAHQRCLLQKSVLPIIIRNSERNALKTYLVEIDMDNKDVWIGLFEDDNGEYKWVNGQELADYHRWYPKESPYQYVHLHEGFKLHPGTSYTRDYICQKKTEEVVVPRMADYYFLEAIRAYPLGRPRKELYARNKIQCAASCTRDIGCYKYTLNGHICKLYNNVLYSTSIEGLRLYRRRLY